MRAILAVLAILAAPARACPRDALCLATSAHAAPVRLQITLAPPHVLDLALREPAPRPPDVAMPWIWQVLRQHVYSRMPRLEDRRFDVVLSPVVVSGTFDSVPGLGLEGTF